MLLDHFVQPKQGREPLLSRITLLQYKREHLASFYISRVKKCEMVQLVAVAQPE
jgi:hypothetical protein